MELNPKQHKIGTNFRTVQEEDKKMEMWTLAMSNVLKYRLYQLIKILASILPMVRTNVLYHALKHCIGDWESILTNYLYYVEFDRL